MPKTELKRNVSYYDEISQSTLTQGSVTPMISITQGTGVNSRIGNQITVKGFHIKGLFNNNAATPNYIRMLLVWSPCDTVTGLTTSYLFTDANQAGGVAGVGSVNGANILYYPVNKNAYRPVWDKVFKLGGSGDPSCTRMFNKFIKMNTTISTMATTQAMAARISSSPSSYSPPSPETTLAWARPSSCLTSVASSSQTHRPSHK